MARIRKHAFNPALCTVCAKLMDLSDSAMSTEAVYKEKWEIPPNLRNLRILIFSGRFRKTISGVFHEFARIIVNCTKIGCSFRQKRVSGRIRVFSAPEGLPEEVEW